MGLIPSTNPAFDALVRTAQALTTDGPWLDMLAENLYWASMESFLQSSLLGAFNRLSSDFLADRERAIAPRKKLKPDLLIMERSRPVHKEWWDARLTRGDGAHKTFLHHARLVVQLKVAWTPKNANGSATLPTKIGAVRKDVDRLKQHVKTPTGAVGVLISGFHACGDGARRVQESLNQLKQALAHNVDSGTEVTFLDNYRPSRWGMLLEDDSAAFSTLWLAQLR